jgi:hypothetical protein
MRRANTAKDKPETTMTRFFIIGAAALLLATGTGHATNVHEFKCGNITVHLEVGKRFEGGEIVRYVYHLAFEEMPDLKIWRTFRLKEGAIPYLNGKRCEVIQ